MRLLLVLLLTACSGPSVVHHVPEHISARYQLNGWPLNRIQIVVRDARPGQERSAALEAALQKALDKALSPPISNPGDKLELEVTLTDAVATLDGNKWRATAKVEAVLSDVWDKVVASYAGRGQLSRTDTLGRRSAERVLDEAIDEAVLQLLRAIDGKSMPIVSQ